MSSTRRSNKTECLSLLVTCFVLGCTPEPGNTEPGTGGSMSTGGVQPGSGGNTSMGGVLSSGGNSSSGGISSTGGRAGSTGGTTTGGASTGGRATGGAATGGKASGGTATGGVAVGGAATGGKATGGATAAGGTGATASATPVSVHGQLKVVGNRIVDQNGKPVVLHGMSMYDWSQQGRQFYNASAVGHLAKDMKCAVLRIPILPANATSGLARVKTAVDACIANGIYAIIDWHSMGGANAAAASTFFASMAAAYGNTPNVMYEPWNEPVNETWATIKAYHQTVVAAIRAVDPDNIIILGTPKWDQQPHLAAADPVTTSTNLAYTFHFYAATHRVASFSPNVTKALNAGVAIFVTEYGGCASNGSGTFDATELQNWWNFLDSNQIGCTNWAVETNAETSSVFVTNTSATGPWTAADLTTSGTTVFAYIASKYAATVTP
jgi:endoglucanase